MSEVFCFSSFNGSWMLWNITVSSIIIGTHSLLMVSIFSLFGLLHLVFWSPLLFVLEASSAQYVSFDELIEGADVITLHCPLTDWTCHLLSDAQFDRMKDSVFIINTSRGAGAHFLPAPVQVQCLLVWIFLLQVINEQALVCAMKSGKVSRASLNVCEHEPEIDAYLRLSYDTSILPHWSTHRIRTQWETKHEMLINFVKWKKTGQPNTPVK